MDEMDQTSQGVPQSTLMERAAVKFQQAFQYDPTRIAIAPGRVNLIGEHLDYNGGPVLPMTINQFTAVAVGFRKEPSSLVRVVSTSLGRRAEFDTARVSENAQEAIGQWWAVVAGMSSMCPGRRDAVGGLDLAIDSDLPIGAGLSSSASLAVASALAIDESKLDPWEMARLCQDVELRFAGVPCGIMDPLCIAAGSAGNCLLIDCQREHWEPIAWPSADASIMVAHTGISRNLSHGQYAARRAECDRAAKTLGVSLLCDVPEHELPMLDSRLDEVDRRRVRHVTSETKRVYAAVEALRNANWKAFGCLMSASHTSLREDFEVSCPELDCIVEIAAALPGVWGSRMTGAGFGGCAVALVETEKAERIANQLAEKYFNQIGLHSRIWICQPAGGAWAMTWVT